MGLGVETLQKCVEFLSLPSFFLWSFDTQETQIIRRQNTQDFVNIVIIDRFYRCSCLGKRSLILIRHSNLQGTCIPFERPKFVHGKSHSHHLKKKNIVLANFAISPFIIEMSNDLLTFLDTSSVFVCDVLRFHLCR